MNHTASFHFRSFHAAFMALVILLLHPLVTRASSLSVHPWTDDASSGIAGSTIWAHNLGNSPTSTTVNGIPVTSVPGTDPSNPDFSIAGNGSHASDSSNNLTGAGSSAIGQQFIYNGDSVTVTLKNLNVGTTYIASFFSVGWDPEIPRRAYFNHGHLLYRVNQNQYGNNNGIRVDHTFVADSETRKVVIVSDVNGRTWHHYGLALRSHQVVENNNDSGPGSLRQAIADTVPGDTITFAHSVNGSTIELSSGQLLIDKPLTIDASNLGSGITINANDNSRVMKIAARDQHVVLHNLSLIGGNSSESGGGISNWSHLTLTNSTLSGNSAESGGGVSNLGNLTLTNSTISGNSADSFGGGILSVSGDVTLSNSTVSQNWADSVGGGIFTIPSQPDLEHEGDTLTLNNSIVAGNSAPSRDNIYQHEGFLEKRHSLTSGDPLLAPLGDYGGPTQTMPPLPGSPAIDAAEATLLTTDQRGAPRLSGSATDIGAVESLPVVVNNANDSGPGSLRDRITQEFVTTIMFDPDFFIGESSNTIFLDSQLFIDKFLIIDASNLSGGITIDAARNSRVMEIAAGAGLTLKSLFLTGGSADSGGGILNRGFLSATDTTFNENHSGGSGGGLFSTGGSTTEIDRCTFSENTAIGDGGGAAIIGISAAFTNSTFNGNKSDDGAGAWFSGGADVTFKHCTIANNTSTHRGGGLRLATCDLTLENTIVAGNSAPIINEISKTAANNDIIRLGVNLIGDNSSVAKEFPTINTNDLVGTSAAPLDALLLPLGDYGGPTRTMPPLPSSPAIDAAGATTLTPDQRGAPRQNHRPHEIGAVDHNYGIDPTLSLYPVPADAAASVSLDPVLSWTGHSAATSFELYFDDGQSGELVSLGSTTDSSFPLPSPLTPNTTYQWRIDSRFGSSLLPGRIQTFTTRASTIVDTLADPGTRGDGLSSLRHAISDAPPNDMITFAPALAGQTISLDGSSLNISRSLTIDASGTSSGITIDANRKSRVFFLSHTSSTITFDSLTIKGGDTQHHGGGIFNGSTLTLNNSTLSGNSAYRGGGIENLSILTLNNSTLSNNSAEEFGGGIAHTDGILTLNNSTLSNNSAGNFGGGIVNLDSTLVLNNSIIAANSAITSTDILIDKGTVNASGIIISDLTGSTLSPSPSVIVGSPLLAPLGNYGGPTQTMPPLPGSPAIDRAELLADTPLTDQHGNPRPSGPLPDIGAVEALPLGILGLASNDGDTIPDILESPDGSYPHLDPAANDSAIDTDGDGSFDSEEVANMTNLFDRNDFLRILNFGLAEDFNPDTNPTATFSIPTFPGLRYQIETGSTLRDFTPLESPFIANDFQMDFEISLGAGHEFVRIRRD